MRLLVAGGTVATAEATFTADVLTENGVVLEVGDSLSRSGAEIVDASGCLVIPGGVDAHTHFGLDVGFAKVSDGFRQGLKAAAMGGVTCIVEHPGFGPQGCGLFHQLDAFRKLADGECCIDYAFHGVAQRAGEGVLADVPRLAQAGYASLKAYTTYAGRLNEEDLLALFDAAAQSPEPLLVAVHCEDHAVIEYLTRRLRTTAWSDPMSLALSRPGYAESLAVRQAIAFARTAGATLYVVHLSTADGVDAVRQARASGLKVIAETCPQYLLLDDSRYLEPDGLACAMAPPLRKKTDQEALWQGVADGTVSVVATDHCAFSLEDKRALGASDVFACPGGVPGVETRLPLLFTFGVLTRRITLERFVDICCTSPARIMGLTRKGWLEPGFDADITVLDPDSERVIRAANLTQAVDYTPYEGMAARGWPRHVLSRGKKVVSEGVFAGEPAWGRFTPRSLEAM
ncbi:MAG: dihydropyrimidinase [Desulfovibrio sp.]|nr:dihydropyrimidinase [Desulfovibrio sp.]